MTVAVVGKRLEITDQTYYLPRTHLATRGVPEPLRRDHGREFTAHAGRDGLTRLE
ncbi:MAG: hypothetical protein AAGG38_11680 [Planctomycetota bacterium]